MKRDSKRGPVLTAVLTALICAGALVASCVWRLHDEARPAPSPTAAPALETEAPAPTAAPIPSPPGPGWLEWKEGQFVAVEYGTGLSTALDTAGFSDPSTKNAHDLAAWAEMAWQNQWGYVWGTFGYTLTEDMLADKLQQYPEDLGEYEQLVREKWMGRRVTDCVGLIKGYGWYDPASNAIVYGSNGMPDTTPDGMWADAAVKGDMDTMPDTPGVLVYSTEGHIGVYIGGGEAIEAISHAGGVVKTKLADRPWTGWLECPYIRYD